MSARTRKPAIPKAASKPATKPAPKATPAPANCGCGCGLPTVTARATFLAGHDARHAGSIGRALAADPTDAQAIAARDAATPKLQAKIEKIRVTAATKAASKMARETAKAAAKKAYADAMAKVTA